MTALTVCNTVCDELGLNQVGSLITNPPVSARRFLAYLHAEGNELAEKYDWPFLLKESSVTLVNGTASYNLPSDYQHLIGETVWDRSAQYPAIGPVTPQEWQSLKAYTTATIIYRRYRLTRAATGEKQITFYPTPGASDDGKLIFFEYKSVNWIAGNKSAITSDSDTFLFPEPLLIKALKYRWLRSQGDDYSEEYANYMASVQRYLADQRGAKTLYLDGPRNPGRFLDEFNFPETGYSG